ncbi:hypothetical protein GCM10010145_03260 [Streptomyces ruber]|uniref:Uncharacterized protein n=2 Tax=Streptomyces TaxID=1883 RepID=A0A918B738_9ACTN|nr:hypothetical protein [Streptomyces ruber]GGQ39110.1 hypothetical protein GCM10010145_03260 [Streptomyces ruber]
MTEVSGQMGHRGAATAVVHESYSFACMRCGHGWEQSYRIEHRLDAEGKEFVLYVADGIVVPSPLSRPTCAKCDGHLVRIMRPGQVSSARNCLPRQVRKAPPRDPADGRTPAAADETHRDHHWHLSDLLHPFHRRTG